MKLPFGKKKSGEEPSAAGDTTVAVKPKKKRKLKKWIIILVIVVVIIIAAVVGFSVMRRGNNAEVATAYTESTVEYRDITSEITGSGTLEAANSYTVTTLVEGEILTADFEEGDEVEEDQLLYTIDSSDTESSIERAEISLSQAQRNYSDAVENVSDLNVKSTISGQVVELFVDVGDDVNNGQTIATVRDTSVMTLKVNFPSDDCESFYVGQSATVTLDSTFETLTGTVTKISGVDTVLSGNRIVHTVTIEVYNPGGISTTQSATATINGVGSSDSGTFEYGDEATITAKVSGTVSSIVADEGDSVSSGGTIIVMTSSDLSEQVTSASESVRTAQLSLDSANDSLDNYSFTAPISGTIIDKNYEAGENVESGDMLCVIYDLSYLTMTLSVDELDVSSIAVGQSVEVTADAVEGVTYSGVVTKVSVAGTASGGVTTYPVTIRIDETDGLLPGMTVDATITLESAENVLAVPASALQRGNTVLLTADSPSAAGGEANESGYVTVEVTTGVSSDDYIEITSGLQEGDVVVYIPTSDSSSEFFGMMGGGMMGGGMDMGGGGGGMPGGGGMGGGF
ncbi:MAG: efflux RND transporter periplasmic adaptor subunit [Oscillospiraceae bacterium]|nr:efflux RND transporter periplasmic adaptor subunit [Oscillospiraceae bacterium]